MRMFFIGLAIIFQIGVIGAMVAPREAALRNGRSVWIRTQPVDPRDPFRGDYVQLSYSISTVPRSLCSPGVLSVLARPENLSRDHLVFAALAVGEDGLAVLRELTDRKPDEGLYLRGRLQSSWDAAVFVRYGLEAYFQEQGKALVLERPPADMPKDARMELEVMIGAGRAGRDSQPPLEALTHRITESDCAGEPAANAVRTQEPL